MSMMISVIIPTFNGAATLCDAVESVRAQNIPVQIIIIDDGSTDETPRVIGGLENVVSLRQTNAGPAAARNSGVTLATAPLLAFLDDDDVWLPTKLTARLRTLDEHPEAIGTLGLTTVQVQERDGWRTLPEAYLAPNLGAALFRREAFDGDGWFDATLPASEDVDFLLRLRDAGRKVITTNDIVLSYRRGANNMTRGKDLRELRLFEVLKRSLDRRRAKA